MQEAVTQTAGWRACSATTSRNLPGVSRSSSTKDTAIAASPITPYTAQASSPSPSAPCEVQMAIATITPTPNRFEATSTAALRLRSTQIWARRLPGVSASTSTKPSTMSTRPTPV